MKLDTSDALKRVSLCGDKIGEYDLEGNIWVMPQYEESESS